MQQDAEIQYYSYDKLIYIALTVTLMKYEYSSKVSNRTEFHDSALHGATVAPPKELGVTEDRE
jgi:hypothetical protein